jgi:single-strand DNA-binding protein
MTGVNKAILIGHLGRDPDIRASQDGAAIASFSIATSENWRDKATGERKERTEWHNIVVFNENLVKIAEQYLKKGAKVYIEGQIRTREYTGKDGVQRRTTEIVLAKFRGEIALLDSRKDLPPPASDQDSYGTIRGQAQKPASQIIDDDIPF